MSGIESVKPASSAPPLQLYNCTHADCGATFTRQWRLNEHETVHTGQSLYQCTVAECGRRYKRKSHLSRHLVQHKGIRQFRCKFSNCSKSFFNAGKLKRHIRFTHGDKNKYFKCPQPKCPLTFKKRRLFKLHLQTHNLESRFCCSKDGCSATFDSHIARRAHEKTHAVTYIFYLTELSSSSTAAYNLPISFPAATFPCKLCKKEFKKQDALRRHKRLHASHKPVLVCPRPDCKLYFSTTFNLQHHIRKVHLQLNKYTCSYPECTRTFAMRESMNRHLLRHDPSSSSLKRRCRSKKAWQKRLDGRRLPLVEEDLRHLFSLKMRVSRRTKVEADLSGLFSERKIPHHVDPEVNLRDLFSLKPGERPPTVAPVKG
uniref:C2H2-type domain-containing protein n=1 Tax=Periophthalmus magnuspinnatus TaxID=409849 RepID=A0A3B3ZDX7_9GOBI